MLQILIKVQDLSYLKMIRRRLRSLRKKEEVWIFAIQIIVIQIGERGGVFILPTKANIVQQNHIPR